MSFVIGTDKPQVDDLSVDRQSDIGTTLSEEGYVMIYHAAQDETAAGAIASSGSFDHARVKEILRELLAAKEKKMQAIRARSTIPQSLTRDNLASTAGAGQGTDTQITDPQPQVWNASIAGGSGQTDNSSPPSLSHQRLPQRPMKPPPSRKYRLSQTTRCPTTW
jgi:hypothetical protein